MQSLLIIVPTRPIKLVASSRKMLIPSHSCFFLEYDQECGYDEPLLDLNLNRSMECDTIERCPLNSYCHQPTHRCCVKVITALLPYRMCREDRQCGRNMMCIDGFCQCAREDLIPARNKRQCSKKNKPSILA